MYNFFPETVLQKGVPFCCASLVQPRGFFGRRMRCKKFRPPPPGGKATAPFCKAIHYPPWLFFFFSEGVSRISARKQVCRKVIFPQRAWRLARHLSPPPHTIRQSSLASAARGDTSLVGPPSHSICGTFFFFSFKPRVSRTVQALISAFARGTRVGLFFSFSSRGCVLFRGTEAGPHALGARPRQRPPVPSY